MIEVRELTKRYGDVLAVDGLSFDVEPGKVTGFLGPNGAGKSTTMRMMLGLDRPTSGTALVNGRLFATLAEPLREVGALLDAGAVHPGRTGRNHLRVAARTHGLPERKVEEVIEQVGLGGAARRRIKGYSLGMRQRLGIAAALQWTPRRTVLFLARAIVAAGTATGLGVLLALAATLTAFAAARPILTLPLGEGVDVLGTVGFVFAAGTLLAIGLGFLLRNTAGALVTVFLLILVLPLLLPQFGYRWLVDIADLLPGTCALFLLLGEPTGRGLSDSSSVITMIGWAAGALLLAWLRLTRDDATG